MKTKMRFRRYFGKKNNKMITFLQTHWFYLLPSIMYNNIKHGDKMIRFNWLWFEFEFTWNTKRCLCDGNCKSE